MNSSETLRNLKVVSTGTIHKSAPNGKRPICGAGDIGVGSRKRSHYAKTIATVTCKKCLDKMAVEAS